VVSGLAERRGWRTVHTKVLSLNICRSKACCHSPDHILLWQQRVRGHLGVRRRVRPRLAGSHSDLSQIRSILLGGAQWWHTDLNMTRLLSKVVRCACRRRTMFLCKVQCQLRLTEAPASYDHKSPPLESTLARLERSSTWERSPAGEELKKPG
jgi:hypothetical protein